MKISAVVLQHDERLAGGLPMKSYHSRGETEVHYDPDLGVVAVFKRDCPDALIIPVGHCRRLELDADLAKRIMAPARSK